MNEAKPMSRRDDWLEFWERRETPFFRALPYILLILCTVFDVAARDGFDRPMMVDLALAVGAAATMAAVDRVDRRASWTETQVALSATVAALVFAVLVGLSAALVIRQPLFGFYSWTGYFWAWRLLVGRARLAGVVLVAAVTAISQTGSGPYDSFYKIAGLIVVFLINVGVAGALTWFGWIGNEQQQRRAKEVSALTRGKCHARGESAPQRRSAGAAAHPGA